MKKLTAAITFAICGLVGAQAQINIGIGNYTQDFNTMGNVTASYPVGWAGWKIAGTGALGNSTVITTSTTPPFSTNNGTDSTGTVYNYGLTGSTERALGSVASATAIAAFGASFLNTAGLTLNASHVSMGFTAEQWRTGSSNATNETWTFGYKIGGALTDLSGWTLLTSFNLNEIATGSTAAGALNGNAPGNFTVVSPIAFTGLSWGNGTVLHIRWADANDLNFDAGMAVDNFSLNVIPEPTTWALLGLGSAFVLWRKRRRA